MTGLQGLWAGARQDFRAGAPPSRGGPLPPRRLRQRGVCRPESPRAAKETPTKGTAEKPREAVISMTREKPGPRWGGAHQTQSVQRVEAGADRTRTPDPELRMTPWGPPGHAELPPSPDMGPRGCRQQPPHMKPWVTVPKGQTVWTQRSSRLPLP